VTAGVLTTLSILAVAACAVWGPIDWSARAFGVPAAVTARIELGLVFSRLASRKTMLFVGDSRAEQLGASGWGNRPLWRVNAGLAGSTAAQWERLLAPRPNRALRYDVAVLWVGVNDFRYADASPEAVSHHVAQLALRLRDYARHVLLLEQTPLRLDDTKRSIDLSMRSKIVNTQVQVAIADQTGIELVPLYEQLRGIDGLLAPWCSQDGLHFNAKGNGGLVDRVAELAL